MRNKLATIILALLLPGCSTLFATGEWSHEHIDAKWDRSINRDCDPFSPYAYPPPKGGKVDEDRYLSCLVTYEEYRAVEHYRADRPWARGGGLTGASGTLFIYSVN